MKGEFEVNVILQRLDLSRTSVRALRHLDRYDAIVFTSKNALRFFNDELKRRRFAPRTRIIQVGPRNDLLKIDLTGQRILFPRSAAAPSDIVRRLRAKRTIVHIVPLYMPKAIPLSMKQKKQLLGGAVTQLYFKSSSGVQGLLAQFRGVSRKTVLAISARCIGETTANAARTAGFKRVFIR